MTGLRKSPICGGEAIIVDEATRKNLIVTILTGNKLLDQETAIKFADIAATEGLATATKALGKSMYSFMGPLLIIVAILGVLAVAIAKLIANYKQLETENKQAAEDLKNTKQAFNDVNNSISET